MRLKAAVEALRLTHSQTQLRRIISCLLYKLKSKLVHLLQNRSKTQLQTYDEASWTSKNSYMDFIQGPSITFNDPKKRKKSPLCSPCHTWFRLERPGHCPTNMSWFVCTCKKITSELLKVSALKAFIGYFFTIPPTYTMFARTDGMASNNINFFSYMEIIFTFTAPFLNLPPCTEREKNLLNIEHCFCRQQESNPGCLCSKQVRYPLLHCISALIGYLGLLFGKANNRHKRSIRKIISGHNFCY